jgi:hypothetical protein
MTEVSDTFYARWRSGRHLGPAKPTHRVLVRQGSFVRDWHPWEGPTVNADIYGESRKRPWSATWTPASDWVEIPNVLSINLDQDLTQRGMTVATITIENTLLREQSGAFGLIYHAIEKGALSPSRGYRPPGLPFAGGPAANEWQDVLVENAQVFVWQGYGNAQEATFVGLIDKVDPTTGPARITLTARDGKVLSDSHILGYNIPKQIHEPIIFQPTKAKSRRVGKGAEASTSRGGHPPRFVTDGNADSKWMSDDHSTAGNTEWVSIRLPQGRYTDFIMDTAYEGMEIFVGLNLKPRTVQTGLGTAVTDPLRNGEPTGVGWVEAGLGDVPGGHGGWPYISHFVSNAKGPVGHSLGGDEFECGDGSILRIGMRQLKKVSKDHYRAGMSSLLGVKLPPRPRGKVKGTKIVKVNDVSDIVRCVLRWAGFKDWKVDDTGGNLEGKLSFNRDSTYADIIDQVSTSTGFYFYMQPPIDQDSLGVPTFKEGSVRERPVGLRKITDRDLLTNIQPSFNDESKAYIIRTRGRGSKNGRELGAQHTKRIMDVYRPPWVVHGNHMARVIKHVVHEDPKIKDMGTLKVFSRLWALQMALAGATAQAEVPGTPEFGVDEQVWLKDDTTGIQTRLWVTRRATAYQAGKNANWKLTIGGALIDTEDVTLVMRDLKTAERQAGKAR